jgi:cob(I)alamin adenosyltransferase
MDTGLVHIYTGEGKGKTTAAVGLSVRCAGAGGRVMFSQFMKGGDTFELMPLSDIPGVTVLRSSKDFPFFKNMNDSEKSELTLIHNRILGRIIADVKACAVDLVVLDELTYAYNYDLCDKELLRSLLELSKGKVEIVITGRNADPFLVDRADYITEMKAVKHPLKDQGIAARKGIEY